MSDAERETAGIGSLPGDLHEAVHAFEQSDMVRDALGDTVFQWYVRNKQLEWHNYRSRITPWEIEQYLPLL